MIMFSFQVRLLILTSSILILSESQSSSIGSQSFMDLSSSGFEFSPIDMQALLLDETTTESFIACAQICYLNGRCRIFDFDGQSHRCRIFEGNMTTMGTVAISSSSQSYMASIELGPEYFFNQGLPCSFCEGSRYLTCINSTCQCQSNTYFDGSTCQSQKLLGGECTKATECRTDMNYACLPRMQCGPISLQIGITVGGYGNGTFGNTLHALRYPFGLSIDYKNTLYISDSYNARIIKLQEGSLMGSIVAGTGVAGNGSIQLNKPTELYVDLSSNIYIADSSNCRVMLWPKNSSTGIRVAGTGSYGNTTRDLGIVNGLIVDSQGNIYVSDSSNHRVMRWAPNATNGTVVAGTGVAGNTSQQLNQPFGIYLDEPNSYLYIADLYNHRIQRYHLGVTTNSTTVAGGNGPGPGSNQLNWPYSVYVSKKTGAIYVADRANNRAQRWSPGATSGVTIAGITSLLGPNATLLYGPTHVTLSLDESYLYVSDSGNNRVQRFKLI